MSCGTRRSSPATADAPREGDDAASVDGAGEVGTSSDAGSGSVAAHAWPGRRDTSPIPDSELADGTGLIGCNRGNSRVVGDADGAGGGNRGSSAGGCATRTTTIVAAIPPITAACLSRADRATIDYRSFRFRKAKCDTA